MLGAANGAGLHRTVHPCTASLRSFAPSQSARKQSEGERLLLRQDAAQMGPLWRGERGRKSPKEGAHDARPFAACTGRALSEPRSPLANSEGRMPGEARHRGVFLLVTFLCTSKEKLPARPKGEWKLCTFKNNKSKKLDSGLTSFAD
jgi:hypothetical protein